jgi:hypothetical protein
MGWTNPLVIGLLAGGVGLLAANAAIEGRIAEPMFQLSLFRIRAFTAGNIAGLAVAIARGGLPFMLIIWLQGVWLPLHGYDYDQTQRQVRTGRAFFPNLISGPFHHGLTVVFAAAGVAALLRGGRYVHPEQGGAPGHPAMLGARAPAVRTRTRNPRNPRAGSGVPRRRTASRTRS